MVKIILDKIYNKTVPKPINLRPGYDMEHVFNYHPQTDHYQKYWTTFSFDQLPMTWEHEIDLCYDIRIKSYTYD